MPEAIHYCIGPKSPAAHLFEVACTVADPDPAGQRFSLPAWIPGSYMIRDFAKHVVTIRAESCGSSVRLEKIDKHTWRCEPCTDPVTVTCEIYAWDLSVRGAHLDQTHGYFNGPSVFLRVHGREQRACLVDILSPDGGRYRNWRIATSMAIDDAPVHGFGRYRAQDYAGLIDHPVEMGEFALAAFEACGVKHEVALTGRHRADMDRLCRDLQRICEQHIRLFGEPAPMDHYVFLITAVGDGYGGLEHSASTSLICSRDDLPRVGDEAVSEGYRKLLGLASHEYFHAWNVKRILPAAFVPYDLTREVHTTLLWAFEGITSYYDDLALVRSGIIEPASYLELLGQTVTRVLRGSGRLKQSVADSSFDAWTKFYRQDENAPNAVVSYYAKGALIALFLDLTLRQETNDRIWLDDVMRALWESYGKPGIGVPEEGVEHVAEQVSGLDLREFFDRAVRGTQDLPLQELLEGVGIGWMVRPAESASDAGGKAATKSLARLATRPVLGVALAEGGQSARFGKVFDGGSAQQAGLAAGDELVAVDGIRATRANLDQLIGSCDVGTEVQIIAFRRDELMEFSVRLQAPLPDTCVLTLLEVDEAVRRRRDAWLLGRRADSHA
jgi:predicted metalloprotease with PDZ domain